MSVCCGRRRGTVDECGYSGMCRRVVITPLRSCPPPSPSPPLSPLFPHLHPLCCLVVWRLRSIDSSHRPHSHRSTRVGRERENDEREGTTRHRGGQREEGEREERMEGHCTATVIDSHRSDSHFLRTLSFLHLYIRYRLSVPIVHLLLWPS